MNKSGDIVMGFGNPVKLEIPLGQVRLNTFIKETKQLELWLVEYLDQPEQLYELWINKSDGTKTTSNDSPLSEP